MIEDAFDLLVELFGDRGWYTRSAIGICNLSMNIPVEIEMIFIVVPAHIQ
jgi:hypothetical protein